MGQEEIAVALLAIELVRGAVMRVLGQLQRGVSGFLAVASGEKRGVRAFFFFKQKTAYEILCTSMPKTQ
jgi:hypothetical protein